MFWRGNWQMKPHTKIERDCVGEGEDWSFFYFNLSLV